MARLLDWPVGLGIRARRPLSGPRSKGASGRQESIGGRYQSVASAFGYWKYEIVLPVARGRLYRRIEGLVTGLHGGANAVRVAWPVPDGLTFKEAGTAVTTTQERRGMPWQNGKPWSNGKNWKVSTPTVAVAAPSPFDATIIQLAPQFWGHSLGPGDEVGFVPFHFGKYMITQDQGDGIYRIWPPLRKAITPSDFATLEPTLAMTLDNESGSDLSRNVDVGEETTLTLSEVFDYDVRTYFTD